MTVNIPRVSAMSLVTLNGTVTVSSVATFWSSVETETCAGTHGCTLRISTVPAASSACTVKSWQSTATMFVRPTCAVKFVADDAGSFA